MDVVELLWHMSVEAVAASMERTAAVMSQCALCTVLSNSGYSGAMPL